MLNLAKENRKTIETFMDSMPIISFIIAYHNEPEAFLQACLESIMALPFEKGEAEIIVVDDGSTLPPTVQDGVKLVRQEQAGLSVARNTGIDHAQGRYIQFVDADDCFIPSAYEAVVDELRNGQTDVVMFRMTTSQQHATKKAKANADEVRHIWRGQGSHYLQHHNLRAAACGYAFRHECLGELRFLPGILHEDELFTPLLFLRANSLVELNVKAYYYRQHDGTITHAKSPKAINKRLNDIHFIIKELQSLDNPLLERRIRQLTVDYLQNTWTLTHRLSDLRRRGSELQEEGLMPLPAKRYSPRYFCVSLLSKAL